MKRPHIEQSVLPGIVSGIHVLATGRKNVDGRDKPCHDDEGSDALDPPAFPAQGKFIVPPGVRA
jgi:hypothetical protein